MRSIVVAIVVGIVGCIVISGCGNDAADTAHQDAASKGIINISVDETFKPVIQEQIKVFESSFPEARINVCYKSEADCLRDLQKDSTRMIMVARGLNKEEEKFFNNKLFYTPRYDVLAYDAIAVLVNKSSNDTVFTIEQLSSYLKGEVPGKQIVLDGKNATSTVRYLLDSVVRGSNFGNNVTAAQSSEAVIDFVANNPGTIGMVGISWIGDETNPRQQEYLKKLKLAFVECKPCGEGAFYKPNQVTVEQGRYTLYRKLYYILKENAAGVGSSFISFMTYERGQLIFRRSGLVPGKMKLGKRTTQISDSE